MEKKSFEETKKEYEEEIYRLQKVAESTQKQYQAEYDKIKEAEQKLLNEYNTEIQRITIGIERLRGAYTALCDMEEGKDPTLVVNGMLKNENAQVEASNEDVNTDEETNNISEEVKEKAHEAVKQAKEKGLVTPYEEFANSELGKETAIKDDQAVLSDAELEAINKQLADNDKTSAKQLEQNVKPDEVPDYLKSQYGLK